MDNMAIESLPPMREEGPRVFIISWEEFLSGFGPEDPEELPNHISEPVYAQQPYAKLILIHCEADQDVFKTTMMQVVEWPLQEIKGQSWSW